MNRSIPCIVTLALITEPAMAQTSDPPPLPPATTATPTEEESAPAAKPDAATKEETPRAPARATVQASGSIDTSPSPSPRRRPRGAGDGHDAERRVVIFTDGQSPSLVTNGDRQIGGPLELEIRFRNANPLCYAYSTNVAASRIAANDQNLPERAPSLGVFGNLSAATYADLDEAFVGVTSRRNDLDDLLLAARYRISLDDVWAACDGNANFAEQRERVSKAAATAAERLSPSGAWTQAIGQAEAAALGAKRLARQLQTEGNAASQQVEARRAALRDAERIERGLRQSGARSDKDRERLDEAVRSIAAAQRNLREAELALARHGRAIELERTAESLTSQVETTMKHLSRMVAELNHARSLIARTPTAIRRRFAPGETVSVRIERQRLERGARSPGRKQVFALPPFEALRPVLLDVGLGPAVGTALTSNYETVWSPRGADDNTPTWRVVRTEQELDVDALISISAYLWKRRYLDDDVLNPWGLLPRPMVGVSLRRPFESIYLGAIIDPIQYVNIGGGVRFANSQELVGPQPLDRALIDAEGEPQPPVTRDEVKATGFVTLTISTNLVYRWLTHGF